MIISFSSFSSTSKAEPIYFFVVLVAALFPPPLPPPPANKLFAFACAGNRGVHVGADGGTKREREREREKEFDALYSPSSLLGSVKFDSWQLLALESLSLFLCVRTPIPTEGTNMIWETFSTWSTSCQKSNTSCTTNTTYDSFLSSFPKCGNSAFLGIRKNSRFFVISTFSMSDKYMYVLRNFLAFFIRQFACCSRCKKKKRNMRK